MNKEHTDNLKQSGNYRSPFKLGQKVKFEDYVCEVSSKGHFLDRWWIKCLDINNDWRRRYYSEEILVRSQNLTAYE